MKKTIVLISLLAGAVSLAGCNGGTAALSQQTVSTEITSATNTSLLGEEDFKKIAVTHAGVSPEQMQFTTMERQVNADGAEEYIVAMRNDLYSYYYKINPSSGKIIVSSMEELFRSADGNIGTVAAASTPATPAPTASTPTPAPATTPAGYIGYDRAKEVALQHAQVSAADAVFKKVELDYDDGVVKYEVEFYTGNTEYDYDVEATTGNVISYDYDIDNFSLNAPNTQGTGDIGESKAKEIALTKVQGATNNNIRIKRDYDDGHLVYEGEIIYNSMEYEFEIDASSGTIIEWSVESIYD